MTSESVKVLLIGNNKTDFVTIRRWLVEQSTPPYQLTWSQTLSDGMSVIKANRFDVLLFDLSIAVGQSQRMIRQLWDDMVGAPIIIICPPDSEMVAVEALGKGVHDYVLQTVMDKDRLVRSINFAIVKQQLKEARKRNAHLEQQLELARLQEEFISLLANEVWLPLLGARLVLEHLLEGSLGEVNQQQKVAIGQLNKGNEELLSLTQEMLDVYTYDQSRSATAFKEVDLREMLSTCVDDVMPATKYRGIKIVADFPPVIPKVLGDASGLKRVFTNLLENAVKASPNKEEVQLRVASSGHEVKIFVTDKGRDIADEDQARLFKRFWNGESGRRYISKAGMHLYMCQRIVDLHKGSLTCSSKPTIGTTFIVTLPTL
ncbi:MAG TPA: HAMP domain-containing sensor histidine kinase [Candidatus Obscuribacterales bacterium]